MIDVQAWSVYEPDSEEPDPTEMVKNQEFADDFDAMQKAWEWIQEGFFVRSWQR